LWAASLARKGGNMGGVKGYDGRGLAENIKGLMNLGIAYKYSELKREIKKKGTWSDQAICQYFMSYVSNLPPARDRWPGLGKAQRFLFLREDGRYELYNPDKHPRTLE
jgi:hypothetical protein